MIGTYRDVVPALRPIARLVTVLSPLARRACLLPALLVAVNAMATPAAAQRLSIADAVAMAQRDNHDLRLARLGIDSAAAAIETAGAAPNPTLTLGVSGINPNAGIGSGGLRSKSVDSSARVDQVFERGGKRLLRLDNAAALKVAAELDAAWASLQLDIAVAQASYDLLAAQERLVLLTQSTRLADAAMAAARQRKQAGDLAGADVARLQVDALRFHNDADLAGAEAARARLALAQLLGHGDRPDAFALEDDWPVVAAVTAPDVEAIVAGRADVRAAQARARAAAAASKLALAARTRDFTVGVQYDHYPVTATSTQGGGNSFGVAIQIPLFVRNQFDGEIRSAALAADAADQTLARIRGAALNEVLRLLTDQRSAGERLQRYETQILPAAKRSADAAEFAFDRGAIAIMDVLDVRRTYRQTQLEAIAVRAEHAKAAVSVAQLAATRYPESANPR